MGPLMTLILTHVEVDNYAVTADDHEDVQTASQDLPLDSSLASTGALSDRFREVSVKASDLRFNS